MIAKYINKSMNGLIKGHEYKIKINKQNKSYVYDVMVVKDITKDVDIGKLLKLASIMSIKRNFDIKEEDIIMEDIDYEKYRKN